MALTNRVNSGDTPRWAILSQAAKAEGATTIPRGSRVKRPEAHGPALAGDDIVCSAWQHAAALWAVLGLANLTRTNQDDAKGIREDLSDLISNISPTDTPRLMGRRF